MEILNQLPDDVQDMIYFHLHKSYMNSIENEIKSKIIERFDNMTINEQSQLIEDLYPVMFAVYSLYKEEDDDNYRYINPNTIFFNGKCMIYEIDYNNNEGITYKSNIMNNPTYGEVFLEIDNLILYFADDFHHIFLESIEIGEEIEENVYKIEFFLGS